MADFSVFVGIDVSKARLDVHCLPDAQASAAESFSVDNTAEGHKMLVDRVRRLAEPHRLGIALEASGGYERAPIEALLKAGLTPYRLDAGQTRSFARAERQRAKTDAIDAALIARAFRALHETMLPCRPDPVVQRLVHHLRLRDLQIRQIGLLRNALENLDEPALERLTRRQIDQLKRHLMLIETQMQAIIAADPAKAELYRRLRTVPGVGPITALSLIARLPELGQLSSRAVAALVGLAPYDRQSGATTAPRRCAGGRPDLRRVLYMAALAIARTKRQTPVSAAFHRLIANGKPFKIAIVALMRKLIVAINAMIANNQKWASQ
jgi:transposase